MSTLKDARMAGALGCLAAAGLHVVRVDIPAPDGTTMYVTAIAAGRPRPDDQFTRWVAAQTARARQSGGDG